MADMTVRQADSIRLTIKAAQLVNRLQDSILGSEEREAKELSATQIQAAKILLDKSLPSLQSADITAHSAPVVETQEALLAKLQALITANPQLISKLATLNTPKLVESTIETHTNVHSTVDNPDAALHTVDIDPTYAITHR